MSENASLLKRALDQTNAVIAAIPADRIHATTPCDQFDLTQLVTHVTVIADRVSTVLDRSTANASSSWEEAYQRLRQLLRHIEQLDQAVPDRMVELPFGRMPLGAALGMFVGEFVTHSWDLAVSTGRNDLLDDGLGARALAMVTARIPREPRTRTPFGDVVPVSADAPVYDQLAGWMGRQSA